MDTVAAAVCTRRTARCADASSYQHALRPCCRGHVIDLVRHVSAAFVAAGVTFWADYGTLLGAVRNPLTTSADYPWLAWGDFPWLPPAGEPIPPGIIPHDKDADFGVLHQDFQKAYRALQALQRDHRFRVHPRPYAGSIKVRISQQNKANLDLFFWLVKPNGRMFRRQYVMHLDRYKGRDFPRDLAFPLGTVEWEGMTLPAPRDPEAFLEMRYGPNWRTPVADNNDGVPR